jgi:serine protease
MKTATRWRYLLASAALLLAACADQQQPLQPEASPLGPQDALAPLYSASSGRAVPGSYIVVLRDDASGASAASVAAVANASPRYVYTTVVRGFAAELNQGQLNALRSNPNVAYVEEDQIVEIRQTTQPNATWGLDRIDQRDRPLNGTYVYNQTGAGVHAYIIDTGIRLTHQEFSGRMGAGFDAVTSGGNANDCNGHGTHVAGTVGGTVYGVAKRVTLYPVRVLNCNGSGTNAGVIAGMDWVAQNHRKPAVANMSLGGGASTTTDNAVQRMVNAGVTVVVAAGNENQNACNVSPARAASAFTVGSTTSSDARSNFSNWGSCVDIFAPGSSITAAWHTSNTATNTISGTSMASPHVAGVVALYLQVNPSATPAQVKSAVVDLSTPNRISSPGTNSPNRLLYSLIGGAPPPPDTVVARVTVSPSTASVAVGATVQLTARAFNAADEELPGRTFSWSSSNTSIATVSASGVVTGRAAGSATITASTAGRSGSASVSVTGGTQPCTGRTATGSLSGTGAQRIEPGGSYYQSVESGRHIGCLSGPAGADFDLYLQRWNGFGWVTVAQSTGPTSTERVEYQGTPGYYRYIVRSAQGSGSYTLIYTRQ